MSRTPDRSRFRTAELALVDRLTTPRRVQRWLDSWQRLAGRFQQAVSSPTLPADQVESGRFEISRPDRMRWDYQQPERKLAVTDGVETWLYLPDDRQVIRGRLETLRRDGAVALLLSGGLRLREVFQVAHEEVAADGGLELVLQPLSDSETVARVDLMAAADGRVLAFTVHDPAGNRVRWSLDDLRLDPELDDGRFRFRIPEGVEVQDLDAAGPASP